MLSVIIPGVGEWPQILFTIRSIAEELKDTVNFEIVVVDNYCEQVKAQGKERDRTFEHLTEVAKGQPWLKVLEYSDKLSHWQAKNLAVEAASGDTLWFCDAHCALEKGALLNALDLYYRSAPGGGTYADLGTFHLPLTYQILEWRKLIYKFQGDPDLGHFHYSFTGYQEADAPYEVPAMSTCGMMMTRQIYDKLGGWPKELGIYGGGENFINYTLAVLGLKKFIVPGGALFHHGDKRGYSWNSGDHLRNKAIAHYVFGGRQLLHDFLTAARGNVQVKERIKNQVLQLCAEHRQLIKSQTKIEIREWIKQWEGVPRGYEKK